MLNDVFQIHLRKCGLICWVRGERAKKKVFYFRHNAEGKRINLKRYGKPRGSRGLSGTNQVVVKENKETVHWHFSISPEVSFHPEPHYKVFFSAVFTNEKFKRFEHLEHHGLRRGICSTWYNREWYEKLLAAMLSISPNLESHTISMEIDEDKFLEVNNEPLGGISAVGYKEPSNVE